MSGAAYVGSALWKQLYVGDVAPLFVYVGDTLVWGATVGDPIELMAGSVGTGRDASTGSNRSATGSMLIDGPSPDRCAVVFVAVSHENWLNDLAAYGALTVTSHLDGQFQRVGDPVFFGQGDPTRTSFQGSVTPFVLMAPSVGLHTITAFCQGAAGWVNSVQFQAQAYKNVLAAGNSVSARVLRDAAPLGLSRPTVRENITLCGVAHDRTGLITGGVSKPLRGSTIGGAVAGAADYLTVLESPLGEMSGHTAFTSVGSGIWGAAAVDLIGYRDGEYVAITTRFDTPGTFTYGIPSGATKLDVIALGSGAGSSGTSIGSSMGAPAGLWSSATFDIGGAEIPPGTTTLSVTVGAGAHWVPTNTPGLPGNLSKVARGGTDLVVAAGGSGSRGVLEGASPGNHTRSDIEYVGGGTAPSNNDGRAPGGGAGGRYEWYASGFGGGDGAVWIRAY